MEIIHIALTFDDKYLEQGIVLMTSILANKGEETIHFHILDGGLSEFLKSKLLDLKNCEIEFHKVDAKIFEHYKKMDYYPAMMLWPMILPDIIKTDRLIYLDCDMVVNTSLKELWQNDLGDNYVAAVEDANGKKYAKRFGLKKESKFFNSGVMLINCKKWREDDISTRAVEISMQNTGTRFGYDQTVLNRLFEGRVKFLDLKWNLQYCPLSIWPSYENKAEYKCAIAVP
ncbi:MAG: glycosyltransferase family 8 protein [Candidatus Gastranaerophilaceae bacterium]